MHFNFIFQINKVCNCVPSSRLPYTCIINCYIVFYFTVIMFTGIYLMQAYFVNYIGPLLVALFH